MMIMINKAVRPLKVAATALCFGVGMIWMMTGKS